MEGLFLLLMVMAGALAAPLAGLFVRYYTLERLRRGTVIAEYEAPHQLKPAELGYLFDRKFGSNELLATIISLMQKSFIKLSKHHKDNPKFVVTHVHDGELKHLSDAEIAVLSWLKSLPKAETDWQSVNGKFSENFGLRSSFQHEVRAQLVQKDYLYRETLLSFHGRGGEKLLASILTILIIVPQYYYSLLFMRAFWGDSQFAEVEKINVILILLMLVPLTWFAVFYLIKFIRYGYFLGSGRPGATTPKLREDWRDIAGYQLFVSTVEFSRLKADSNPNDPVMPYAVALGFKPDLAALASYRKS